MADWRSWIGQQSRGVRVAALLAALCLGYSAQGAIRAIIAHPVAAAPAPAPAMGYEVEDHFPGAAALYAADADAAPTAGATGTAALPDMPLPAGATDLITDASIHPAPPFSMATASPLDRARALDCLTTAIYYEAASEPEAGQRAVAQVILNRVRHPAFPNTVCGVIYQGSEHAGCQFSYACDGAMRRTPDPALWRRALRVAAEALAGQVYAPVGMATHYHTYAVRPAWNRQMVMTAAIGAHFFHRWQGWWGTPAAFTQIYRGGEPLPGPHAPIAAPTVPAPVAIAALDKAAPAVLPRTATAAIQPGYAESGVPQSRYAAPASNGTDTADSQILDKWKDSGKPLR